MHVVMRGTRRTHLAPFLTTRSSLTPHVTPHGAHRPTRPSVRACWARWTAANTLAWALALPLFFATLDAMAEHAHLLWLGMGEIALIIALCQAVALRYEGVSTVGWIAATTGGVLLSVWLASFMVGNDRMDAVFILQPIGIMLVGLCQGLALHAQRRLRMAPHGLTWIGVKVVAAGCSGGLVFMLCSVQGTLNPTCGTHAALLGGALSGMVYGAITGAALARWLTRTGRVDVASLPRAV